jgi:hypothetical protein
MGVPKQLAGEAERSEETGHPLPVLRRARLNMIKSIMRFKITGLGQDRREDQSQKVRRSVQARTGFEAVEAKPILNFALRSCMLFNSDSGLGGGG